MINHEPKAPKEPKKPKKTKKTKKNKKNKKTKKTNVSTTTLISGLVATSVQYQICIVSRIIQIVITR